MTDVQQQLIVPQHRETGDSVSYTQLSLPSSSKSKAPLKAISNPSQALAHLEKHNAKLASMDPERRKQVEENERWAKAEERAKGVKVVDQEGTLKKAVKRLEKKKSKSGKEWCVVVFFRSTCESDSSGRTGRRRLRNPMRLRQRRGMIISPCEMSRGRTRRWVSRRRTRLERREREARVKVDLDLKVERRARSLRLVGLEERLPVGRSERCLMWSGQRVDWGASLRFMARFVCITSTPMSDPVHYKVAVSVTDRSCPQSRQLVVLCPGIFLLVILSE